MTNREKFREVFNKDIHWSRALEPQILALKSAHIDGIDCMEEWLNTEYKKPTTKNDLAVDCIDRAELLKAMDTWDKFGNDPNEGLIPLRTPALQDRYVPYVKYDDMVNCVRGMLSVTPQPRKGHWINITDQNLHDYRTGNKLCYECSQCNSQFRYYFSFCPNCGADMRGEEE